MSSRGERSAVSRLLVGANTANARPLIWQGPDGGPPSDPGTGADAKSGASAQRSAPEGECRDPQHLKVLMEQQAKIQELERQVESRPRQAYQQGFNEGQTAATKQVSARIDPVLAKLATSIQDLAAVRKRHLVESEVDAVKLAIAVARRILHRELSVDADSILGVVKATVERVDSRRCPSHPDASRRRSGVAAPALFTGSASSRGSGARQDARARRRHCRDQPGQHWMHPSPRNSPRSNAGWWTSCGGATDGAGPLSRCATADRCNPVDRRGFTDYWASGGIKRAGGGDRRLLRMPRQRTAAPSAPR